MKMVLNTDETRATLNLPSGWREGWVRRGQECYKCFRREQGGGGIMISQGIIGVEVLVHIRVPKGVNITSTEFFLLSESALLPRLDDVPLIKRCKLIFSMVMLRPFSKGIASIFVIKWVRR